VLSLIAIDLFNPTVIPSGPIELGTHERAAGQHKLTVEIVDANPAAISSLMLGLDRAIVEPGDIP
jgi:hypothetical protein